MRLKCSTPCKKFLYEKGYSRMYITYVHTCYWRGIILLLNWTYKIYDIKYKSLIGWRNEIERNREVNIRRRQGNRQPVEFYNLRISIRFYIYNWKENLRLTSRIHPSVLIPNRSKKKNWKDFQCRENEDMIWVNWMDPKWTLQQLRLLGSIKYERNNFSIYNWFFLLSTSIIIKK